MSHQLEELRGMAERQADDGPEGLVATLHDAIMADGCNQPDMLMDLLDQRYARGVADFIAYLQGSQPSTELMELLVLKKDVF